MYGFLKHLFNKKQNQPSHTHNKYYAEIPTDNTKLFNKPILGRFNNKYIGHIQEWIKTNTNIEFVNLNLKSYNNKIFLQSEKQIGIHPNLCWTKEVDSDTEIELWFILFTNSPKPIKVNDKMETPIPIYTKDDNTQYAINGMYKALIKKEHLNSWIRPASIEELGGLEKYENMLKAVDLVEKSNIIDYKVDVVNRFLQHHNHENNEKWSKLPPTSSDKDEL